MFKTEKKRKNTETTQSTSYNFYNDLPKYNEDLLKAPKKKTRPDEYKISDDTKNHLWNSSNNFWGALEEECEKMDSKINLNSLDVKENDEKHVLNQLAALLLSDDEEEADSQTSTSTSIESDTKLSGHNDSSDDSSL